MVVVRESIGGNFNEDTLLPAGKMRVKLPDGREIDVETASWQFIGDVHIRFVFDGPQTMINATPADLERFSVRNVDEALALALANLKQRYGEPMVRPAMGKVMEVFGRSPYLNSSYFLDRAFWMRLAEQHREGVVVSVVSRHQLLYAPRADAAAVGDMRRRAAALYAGSAQQRVSSALFLFKDGRWSVFQAPASQ